MKDIPESVVDVVAECDIIVASLGVKSFNLGRWDLVRSSVSAHAANSRVDLALYSTFWRI